MIRVHGVHYCTPRASGRQKDLMKFHYFCQKQAIIKKARELKEIIFHGNNIPIYHRISVSTLGRRWE